MNETAAETPTESKYVLHRRFDRMGRLVGDTAMEKLFASHVMVIGLGGVGSWAAESLARSGVGRLTLVDFDEICVTNFNRQLHAVQGAVGKVKAEVMAERLRKVNPQAEVRALPVFYNADHCEQIFGWGKGGAPRSPLGGTGSSAPSDTVETSATVDIGSEWGYPDFVVDAIDNITAKCHLIDFCLQSKIPIVCSTGSSGRLDPTRVKIVDLAKTELDPLARSIRRILREKHGFPAKGEFGIPAVYSDETVTEPQELHYDGGKGFKCVCPQGDNQYFQCDNRNIILGNAGFVTGAFGLACASVVVRKLISG